MRKGTVQFSYRESPIYGNPNSNIEIEALYYQGRIPSREKLR